MSEVRVKDARGAVLPWFSLDAAKPPVWGNYGDIPQQEIDFCLECPYSADACGVCDGHGNLAERGRGRPKKELDGALLREMLRLKKCNAEMCAVLGCGMKTLIREKKKLLGEDIQ